jgi:hypothetical protein
VLGCSPVLSSACNGHHWLACQIPPRLGHGGYTSEFLISLASHISASMTIQRQLLTTQCLSLRPGLQMAEIRARFSWEVE